MKTGNHSGVNMAGTRSRRLIVDDNQDILSLMPALAAQLCAADMECYQSPKDALAAFESAAGDFELIITDLEMPGMSGIELGQRLLALAPKTKILLATGSEVITDAEAREMGFCGLLHKPFSTGSLRHWLNSVGLRNRFEDFPAPITALTPA